MDHITTIQSQGNFGMSINIKKILDELKYVPSFDQQIGLQSVYGIVDPFYATGRITDKKHKEEEFVEFCFDFPYTNQIIHDLGMYRTRVMRMNPKTCYTYHQDPTQRIHIPLVTNDKCFIILDKEVIHLPADGNHYLIDTTKYHTAVNASHEVRTHIIGCI